MNGCGRIMYPTDNKCGENKVKCPACYRKDHDAMLRDLVEIKYIICKSLCEDISILEMRRRIYSIVMKRAGGVKE